MSYTPTVWKNTPDTSTPINDARLNKLENGVADAAAIADNAWAGLGALSVEWLQDQVANMLRAGSNIGLSYDDNGGLLTISASGTGNGNVTIAGITDATDIGKLLLGAASAAAARSTLGAQAAGDYVVTNTLNSSIDSRISANQGIPNGGAKLGPDGKLLTSQLPELAITRAFPVSSQAAMLALDAQTGDLAIRTDVAQNFILNAEPATTLGNWIALSGTAGTVSSVAGRTGAVTLAKGDVGLSNVDNTSDANKPISTETAVALNARVVNIGNTPGIAFAPTKSDADSANAAGQYPEGTLVVVGSIS